MVIVGPISLKALKFAANSCNMSKIMYRSTLGKSPIVDRKTAIFNPQPPDGSIYVPTYIPKFEPGEIESLRGKSLPEVDFVGTYKFLKDEIPEDKLWEMSQKAMNFPIPIEHVYDRVFSQRQGMGPTGAFKDTAARKLAYEASHYIFDDGLGESWLVVATSGDTGAAIRGGFYGVPGINVIIMYPKGNVTPEQAALMNRYGHNIIALGCEGKFSDLQAIAFEAFGDPDLEKYKLWSANSLGIGRAQPQITHPLWALADENVMESGEDPIFVVPSGNYGHTYAFNLAKNMGAFNSQIVVANNENNVFDRFMKTGIYDVRDTIPTISNAMDVDDPSNLRRIFDMFEGSLVRDRDFVTKEGQKRKVCRLGKMPDMDALKEAMWTITISDERTKETIKRLYEDYEAIFEAHGGGGMAAIEEYRKIPGNENKTYVGMATAHEAKFSDVLRELDIPFETPGYMKEVMDKPSFEIPFSNDYGDFKEFLLSGEAERIIREQKAASE